MSHTFQKGNPVNPFFIKNNSTECLVAAFKGQQIFNAANVFDIELFDDQNNFCINDEIILYNQNQFKQLLTIKKLSRASGKLYIKAFSKVYDLKKEPISRHFSKTSQLDILNTLYPFSAEHKIMNCFVALDSQYKQNNLEYLQDFCARQNIMFYQNQNALTFSAKLDEQNPIKIEPIHKFSLHANRHKMLVKAYSQLPTLKLGMCVKHSEIFNGTHCFISHIYHRYSKEGYRNNIHFTKENPIKFKSPNKNNPLRIATVSGESLIDLDQLEDYLIKFNDEQYPINKRTPYTKLINTQSAALHFPLKNQTKIIIAPVCNLKNQPIILGSMHNNIETSTLSSHTTCQIHFNDQTKKLQLMNQANQINWQKNTDIKTHGLTQNSNSSIKKICQDDLSIQTKSLTFKVANTFQINSDDCTLNSSESKQQAESISYQSFLNFQCAINQFNLQCKHYSINATKFKFDIFTHRHQGSYALYRCKRLTLNCGHSSITSSRSQISIKSCLIRFSSVKTAISANEIHHN